MVDKRDTSLNLSEGLYLAHLKDSMPRIDPLTKVILEQQHSQIDQIAEGLGQDVWRLSLAGSNFTGTRLLTNAELEKLVSRAKEAGEIQGHDQGYISGYKQARGETLALFSTIAVVAAITAISVYVYKRLYSKAARACGDKLGEEKSECMAEYRVKALQFKAKTLAVNATAHCKKTKSPAKCKALINQKLNKIKANTRKIRGNKND